MKQTKPWKCFHLETKNSPVQDQFPGQEDWSHDGSRSIWHFLLQQFLWSPKKSFSRRNSSRTGELLSPHPPVRTDTLHTIYMWLTIPSWVLSRLKEKTSCSGLSQLSTHRGEAQISSWGAQALATSFLAQPCCSVWHRGAAGAWSPLWLLHSYQHGDGAHLCQLHTS